MISLQSEDNGKVSILFSPYTVEDDKGNKRTIGKRAKRDLIYGHTCKECGNVIQALFLTDKEIDQRECEETTTLAKVDSYSKETKVIRPATNRHWNSHYSSKLIQNGGKVSAQLIKLDEHFEPKLADDKIPVCKFASVFSFNKAVLMKSIIMLSESVNPEDYSIGEHNIKELEASFGNTHDILVNEDVTGKYPAVWSIKRGVAVAMLIWRLNSFLKKN